MPQGWSIRNLSCFKVTLSGGYGNRPEPTGHATYPQPLPASLTEQTDIQANNTYLLKLYRNYEIKNVKAIFVGKWLKYYE
jgi:hypothetical protein